MRAPVLVAFGIALAHAGMLHAQQERVATPERALELALSEETGEVRYRDRTDIGGQQNGEVAYALFLSEERDVVASAGLLMGTDLDFGSLELKVGPQAYAALLDEENSDVFALSVGAMLRLNISRSRGLAVTGTAFYSPDILTFGSADNLKDFMARAEIRLSQRVIGFAGYRWFELDLLDRQERKLQNEIFVGVNYELR